VLAGHFKGDFGTAKPAVFFFSERLVLPLERAEHHDSLGTN